MRKVMCGKIDSARREKTPLVGFYNQLCYSKTEQVGNNIIKK